MMSILAVGPVAFAVRLQTLFHPPSVRGLVLLPYPHDDALTVHGNAAAVTANLSYQTPSGTPLMRECRQDLILQQHAWRLDTLVCSPPAG